MHEISYILVRLMAAIANLAKMGSARIRRVQAYVRSYIRSAENAGVEEFFVIPGGARRSRRMLWPTSSSAKRWLVAGSGLLLSAALVAQILPGPAAPATAIHGLVADGRAAPGGGAETARYAANLEQKLGTLAATIARDRAAALAPMRALREDHAAQIQKTERLAVALAQFSEEFSQKLARLQKVAERNAARLMAVDGAALAPRTASVTTAPRPATAPGILAPRGKRPPLRLAAIEYRNKAPAAVVLMHGRRRSLRKGDALAGYTVAEISVADRTLTLLETATGKHYVLVAGTNYVAEYGAHPQD